jgi:hypothetical protein
MANFFHAAKVADLVAAASDNTNGKKSVAYPSSVIAKRYNINEWAIFGTRLQIDILRRAEPEDTENYRVPGYFRQSHLQSKTMRTKRNKPL